MKPIPYLTTATILLLCAASAHSREYADASSPSEAVGMMTMTIEISSLMQKECSERFPEQREEIASDIARWRKQDAREIAASEKAYGEMVRQDPTLPRQISNIKLAAKDKLFKPSQSMSPKEQRKIQRDYCRQYFSELASGIWREREPRKYYYLGHYK